MIFEGKGKRDEEEKGEMGEGNGSDFLTVPDMLLFVACDSSPILEGKKGGLSRPQKFSLLLCFCLFLHKNVRFSPLLGAEIGRSQPGPGGLSKHKSTTSRWGRAQ